MTIIQSFHKILPVFKSSILFLFFFVSINFSVLGQTSYKSEDDLKKNAGKLFEEEEFAQALPLYSQLLSLHPQESEYYYKYGVCLLYGDRRDTKKPIKYLEIASHNPDVPPEVYYYLAYAYHQNYRFSEAINFYTLFKQKTSSSKKFNVDQQIQMCQNGQLLLTSIKDIYVLEKREVNSKDYFRSYNDQGFGGKLLLKPEEFKSKTDRKKKDNTIIFLCDTGKIIYFSSFGDNTGNKDIFTSHQEPNGNWSKPTRLRNNINTLFDEDYPFVLPNGHTLYFCSKGHNSMGGYDIFRSDYDTIKKEWGEPVNLDFAINTPFDDILFVTDTIQQYACFSSNRSSAEGLITVYKVRIDQRPEERYDVKVKSLASQIDQDTAYQKSLVLLSQKAQLNVNATPSMFKNIDAKLLANKELSHPINNQNSNLPSVDEQTKNIETKQEPGTTIEQQTTKTTNNAKSGSISVNKAKPKSTVKTNDENSNEQIYKDIIAQNEQLKDEINQLENKKNTSAKQADQKKQEAKDKNQQADEITTHVEKITNPKDKKFEQSLAKKLRSEADQLETESEIAADQALEYEDQLQQKNKELKENEEYVSDIKKTMDSKSVNPDITDKTTSISNQPNQQNTSTTTTKENIPSQIKIGSKKNELSDNLRKSADSSDISAKKLKQGSIIALYAASQKANAAKTKLDSIDKLTKKIAGKPESNEKEQVIAKINTLKSESKKLSDDAEKNYNLSIVLDQTATEIKNESNQKRKNANEIEHLLNQNVKDSSEQIKKLTETTSVSTATKEYVNQITQLEKEINTNSKENLHKTIDTKQLGEEIIDLQNKVTVNPVAEQKSVPIEKEKPIEQKIVIDNTTKNVETKPVVTPQTIKHTVPLEKEQINTLVSSGIDNRNTYETNKDEISKVLTDGRSKDGKNISKNQINEIKALEEDAEKNIQKADQLRKEAIDLVTSTVQKGNLLEDASQNEMLALEKQNRILFIIGINNTSDESKSEQQLKKSDTDYSSSDPKLNETLKQYNSEKLNSKGSEFDKLYTMATEYMTNKQYKEAFILFNKLLKSDTTNANLNYQTGTAYIKIIDNKSNALKYFLNASRNISIKYNNSSTQRKAPVYTYYYLGLIYQYQKDCDKALTEFNNFTDIASKLQTTEYNDILEDIEFLTSMCKNQSLASTETVPDKNQKSEANKINAIEKTKININTKDLKGYYNEAITLMNDNMFDKALPILLNMQKKDTINSNFNYLIGVCYYELIKDKKKAIFYFRKAELMVDPDYKSSIDERKAHPRVYYYLGKSYQYAGDCEKSTFFYNQYKKYLSKKDDDIIDEINNLIELCNQQLKLESKPLVSTNNEVKQPILYKDTVKSVNLIMVPPVITKNETSTSISENKLIPAKDSSKTVNKITVEKQVEKEITLVEPTNKMAQQNVVSTDKQTTLPVIDTVKSTLNIQSDNQQQQGTSQKNLTLAKEKSITKTDEKQPVANAKDTAKPIAINHPVQPNQKETTQSKTANTVKKPVLVTKEEETNSSKDSIKPFPLTQTAKQTAEKNTSVKNENQVAIKETNDKPEQKNKKETPQKTIAVSKSDQQNKQTNLTDQSDIYINKSNTSIVKETMIIADINKPESMVSNYSNFNPIPMDHINPEGVIFKIQIGAFKKPVPNDLFIGIKPIVGETTSLPGIIRYMAGEFIFFKEADNARINIKKLGYNDCFVVAYFNGKRININKAIELSKGVVTNTNKFNISETAFNNNLSEINITSKRTVIEIKSIKDIIYTVQVGFYKNDSFPAELSDIEPLYKETLESGFKRYMAGLYTDRNSAVKACNQIRDAGHKDVFVTVYHQGNRITFEKAEQLITNQEAKINPQIEKPVVITLQNNIPKDTFITVPESDITTNDIRKIKGLFYTVQFGVYRKILTPDKIYNIEPIYIESLDNGLIKHLTGVYFNLPDAIKRKNEIVKTGIPDAFVVAYHNGKRISIAEAKNLKIETPQPVDIKQPIKEVNQKNQPIEIPTKDYSESIYFRVQLGMFMNDIPEEIMTLYKKVVNTNFIAIKEPNGLFVYTKDIFTDYNSANEQKNQISSSGVEQVIVAAFKGEKRISMDKALELLKK